MTMGMMRLWMCGTTMSPGAMLAGSRVTMVSEATIAMLVRFMMVWTMLPRAMAGVMSPTGRMAVILGHTRSPYVINPPSTAYCSTSCPKHGNRAGFWIQSRSILRPTMRTITSYVLFQLATGTILVTAGLLSVAWLTQSLRYIELIVTQGVSVHSFLTLTGLLLPGFLSLIMPVALFMVVLFTYNRLNTDRELVVIRAAGVGPFGLARPALILAFVMMAAGYSLTLWLGPESARSFKELQWSLRNDASKLMIQDGTFNDVATGLTVYTRARTSNGELLDVMIHDTRTPGKTNTIIAERGAVASSPAGPVLILGKASSHQVTLGTGTMALLDFERLSVNLSDQPEKESGQRYREAQERPTSELLTVTEKTDLTIRPADVPRFRAEAMQRLFNPISYICFVLIALAGLLSGAFSRRGHTRRIALTATAMVLVQSGIIGAGNLASHATNLLPLIPAAVLLPTAIALFILARSNQSITVTYFPNRTRMS